MGLRGARFNPLEVDLPMILFEVLTRKVLVHPGEYLPETEFMTYESQKRYEIRMNFLVDFMWNVSQLYVVFRLNFPQSKTITPSVIQGHILEDKYDICEEKSSS